MSTTSSVSITCSVNGAGHAAGADVWGGQLGRPVDFVRLNLDGAADAGVNKALQIDVYAAAQNQFDENQLFALFRGFPWEYPGEAVLIVYHENGPPRILRRDG